MMIIVLSINGRSRQMEATNTTQASAPVAEPVKFRRLVVFTSLAPRPKTA